MKATLKNIAIAVNNALSNMDDSTTLNDDLTVADVKAWFETKIEQADSRAAKAKVHAAEKKAEANAPIVDAVKTALADGEAKTIKAMKADNEALADVSPQKIAAVIRHMDGITTEKVKGVNTYKLG